MDTTHRTPLWQQLQQTALILQAVQAGRSATPELERVTVSERPGVQALTFEALRHWGRAQALCQHLAQRPPPPAAKALLCAALSLIWREDGLWYEPYTLVHQTVEAARRSPALRAQATFINACLRRFLRQRTVLISQTDDDPVAYWNYPAWWITRVRQEHPAHWQAVLQTGRTQAPMVLRINPNKTTQASYLQKLSALNVQATAIGEQGILLAQASPVSNLPGFHEGYVSVQDWAAQLAAPLLLNALNMPAPRVLDACAAPGGKTAHLLEISDSQVTALDIDPKRCDKISSNLQRLGLHAQVLVADATQPQPLWSAQPYDGILLDAPCTASGIVRRHPDIPWLRRESDVTQLTATQARLLQTLWPLLRPGGYLLYATCSIFHAEGSTQIQAFVQNHPNALNCSAPGHLLPDNAGNTHDGFYYALLQKRN